MSWEMRSVKVFHPLSRSPPHFYDDACLLLYFCVCVSLPGSLPSIYDKHRVLYGAVMHSMFAPANGFANKSLRKLFAHRICLICSHLCLPVLDSAISSTCFFAIHFIFISWHIVCTVFLFRMQNSFVDCFFASNVLLNGKVRSELEKKSNDSSFPPSLIFNVPMDSKASATLTGQTVFMVQ